MLESAFKRSADWATSSGGSTVVALERELESYLLSHRQTNSVHFVQHLPSNLLLLAESHAGWDRKARFLAEVIVGAARLPQPRFHASEHFIADGRTRATLEQYLDDAGGLRALPDPIARFRPTLDAAKGFPGRAFAIIAGGSLVPADRDRALYLAFRDSLEHHNHRFPSNRIGGRSRGSYLIGANHGARRSPNGASPATTTELLQAGGWQTCVVRFTVNAPLGAPIPDDSGETTYFPFEDAGLEPLEGGDPIDLLAILNRVAEGAMFHAPLGAADSPFARVKEAGGLTIPFNALFDYVLHLA